MGDKATMVKAREELENLYLGVPDFSVDLTLKDLPSFQQNEEVVTEKKKKTSKLTEPIHEEPKQDVKEAEAEALGKSSPSLDFSKGLRETGGRPHRHVNGEIYREQLARNSVKRNVTTNKMVIESRPQVYDGDDDISGFSKASNGTYEGRGGRRRPGIPHSNICALCSVSVYIFRHRCLVCGRVYCRECVGMGMGEMAEGRKCIECLGRRFSQRYIQKAGEVGCCCSRYPSAAKKQELMWAEKGPRKSGERGYGRSGVVSRSRSPARPGTPTRSRISSNPASFVMSPAYSPTSHAFPF